MSLSSIYMLSINALTKLQTEIISSVASLSTVYNATVWPFDNSYIKQWKVQIDISSNCLHWLYNA